MRARTTPNLPRPRKFSSGQVAARESWAPVMICLIPILVVFSVVFRREIAAAFKVWCDSTAYNHCFLVLPLVGILLWMRRDTIASLRPSPSIWPLALLPIISFGWAAAALVDIQEAQQLAIVALFELLLLVLVGWETFRALLAPLLFLFFLVPFGAFLVPLLQRFTAAFAAHGLEALGIPTFADGFVIEIPEGSFEVAEACAGLRFLIASIVFGCFFATVVYRSKLRRAFFITLAIFVPILANGLRALGLILLAHLWGSAAAVETDHVLYGWLFFTLVTLILIGLGLPFADRIPIETGVSAFRANAAPPSKMVAFTAAGLALALIGPAYLMVEIARAAASPIPTAAAFLAPAADTGWTADKLISDGSEPVAPTAASSSAVRYRHEGDSVTEFVALYRLPDRSSPLIRSATSTGIGGTWRTTATGERTVALGPASIMVNTARIEQNGQHRLLWWFYMIDARAVANTLEAKLLEARTALSGGSHLGAFVAISTGVSPAGVDSARLARFLDAICGTEGDRSCFSPRD